MKKWSDEIEAELSLLIKEWLKQHGKTQKDLKLTLGTDSERMPALIKILKKEYLLGGLPKLASKLCTIEENWHKPIQTERTNQSNKKDPFSQLDLLLEELKEDCSN